MLQLSLNFNIQPTESSKLTEFRLETGWRNISEFGAEVGLSAVYAEEQLIASLRDPDQAFLWEVLYTARFYLVELGDTTARFTLNLGGQEYRFVASQILQTGVAVRLDSESL